MKAANRLKRIPPYIFAQIDEKKAEAKAKGIDIVDLGIGDPDQPTPDFIVEKMVEEVRNPANHDYPPYQGTQAFRESIAAWYQKRFNVSIDPNSEVISLIGSKEGIVHSFMTFLDNGDIALLPDPGYPAYNTGVLIAGGEPVMIPVKEENNYEPDLDAIDPEIATKAKMIFINFPGNPTGAVARDEFYEKAIAWAKKYQVLICTDMAYSEVYYDGEKPRSILEFPGAKDCVLEFHSLSKSFNMTGWRVGMAVGNAEAIKALGTIKTNIDSGVFKAIQNVAIHALEHGDQVIDDMNALYQTRRDIIVNGLNELGWNLPKPKATYYIWAPLPPGFTSQEFTIWLLEETGILVVPGTGYGANGEGYFRISITTATERLEEAITRLKAHNIRFDSVLTR